MSGTRTGGLKCAATNKLKHGQDFYNRIGSIGGKAKNPKKGFGSSHERAVSAGHKGRTQRDLNNEDWEDYNPSEPLIKDEKIRKAVRAWAEVNDVKKVTVEKDFSTYAFYPADTDRVSISIWTEPSLSNLSRGNVYTIAELCGEEEE